jgi:hypothetical protein
MSAEPPAAYGARRMAGTMSHGASNFSDRVHQATGMLSARLGCSLAEALDRLVERADLNGQSLDDIAADVVDRVKRVTPVTHPGQVRHEYEVNCACGTRWRIIVVESDVELEQAECVACGADTFDLVEIGRDFEH